MAPTHRHKKRGTEYELVGYGRFQSGSWLQSAELSSANPAAGLQYVERVSADMAEVAIYRAIDEGTLWVRPREEFEDGRFELLEASDGDTAA